MAKNKFNAAWVHRHVTDPYVRQAQQKGGYGGQRRQACLRATRNPCQLEQHLTAQKHRHQRGRVEQRAPPVQPCAAGAFHQVSGSIVLLRPLALSVSL